MAADADGFLAYAQEFVAGGPHLVVAVAGHALRKLGLLKRLFMRRFFKQIAVGWMTFPAGPRHIRKPGRRCPMVAVAVGAGRGRKLLFFQEQFAVDTLEIIVGLAG